MEYRNDVMNMILCSFMKPRAGVQFSYFKYQLPQILWSWSLDVIDLAKRILCNLQARIRFQKKIRDQIDDIFNVQFLWKSVPNLSPNSITYQKTWK